MLASSPAPLTHTPDLRSTGASERLRVRIRRARSGRASSGLVPRSMDVCFAITKQSRRHSNGLISDNRVCADVALESTDGRGSSDLTRCGRVGAVRCTAPTSQV